MNIYQKDRDILRRLATKYAGIAAQSVHKQTIHHWQRINALDPVKPMVSIDQICWHEMNVNAELTLLCENKFCRDMEWTLRSTLYKWVHFPCDMVVMPYVEISKSIGNSGYGIDVKYEDG